MYGGEEVNCRYSGGDFFVVMGELLWENDFIQLFNVSFCVSGRLTDTPNMVLLGQTCSISP